MHWYTTYLKNNTMGRNRTDNLPVDKEMHYLPWTMRFNIDDKWKSNGAQTTVIVTQ